MFLILAPSRGFSIAENPMVSFALTPDQPWLPWQRKFENFWEKIGYNWASMGDMFLILAPSRGFSMAAISTVSFTHTPDRPWLPWQQKFENFSRKLAITGLLWEICSWFLHQVGVFRWQRIQWCHLHLPQTDSGCHGNENLQILAENWL